MKIKATRTVYLQDIQTLCEKYPQNEIIIVMENTKNQSPEELNKIARMYPNITFSVTGGLDPSKRKFNSENYQKRTYYTPLELSKIIEIYRSIEKNIDLSWTETQKAMYIYMELCNRMEYSENYVGGKDCARGIGALLYGKAVCAGFAMIYKEALERMGIECHYQNIQHYHAWNIAKLDGAYRGLELTWDTSSKGKEGCAFKFFGRTGSEFYSIKEHSLVGETEEYEFPIVPYTYEELVKNYRVITNKRVIRVDDFVYNDGAEESKPLKLNGIPFVVRKGKNGVVTIRNLSLNQYLQSKQFFRKDGSQFILVPLNKSYPQLYCFALIEQTSTGIKMAKIFSEADLANLSPEYDSSIADGLLRQERLVRKINGFNGYVGYIGRNHAIYANVDFERNVLNVFR